MSTILVDHDFCQIAWLAWFNSGMRIKYDRTCQRSIKIISIEKTFALHKSEQRKHFFPGIFFKRKLLMSSTSLNQLKIENFEKWWFFYPGWYLKALIISTSHSVNWITPLKPPWLYWINLFFNEHLPFSLFVSSIIVFVCCTGITEVKGLNLCAGNVQAWF